MTHYEKAAGADPGKRLRRPMSADVQKNIMCRSYQRESRKKIMTEKLRNDIASMITVLSRPESTKREKLNFTATVQPTYEEIQRLHRAGPKKKVKPVITKNVKHAPV